MMDLQDQLKHLFPDHVPQEPVSDQKGKDPGIWIQEEALLCKYEKRKGKPVTIIEGYNGAKEDFKGLAQMLKKRLSVGGGIKKEEIVIQGNYRDEIMSMLKELGFHVKRVGG
jgi:translation initiation factor 1